MSRQADEAQLKSKGNGKRGSVNNAGRLSGFKVARSETVGKADWTRADPRWVMAVVGAASAAGCEVAFSYTKDGGAFGLKLFDFGNGERVQLWFNGDCDLDGELEQVYYTLGGV